MTTNLDAILPVDWRNGRFLGRVDGGQGPVPVLIEHGRFFDLSRVAATVSGAIERGVCSAEGGDPLGEISTDNPILPAGWTLLSPIDLQCIKASGVTFAVSAIERVIEEAARGDPAAARELRDRLEQRVGQGIRSVVPGSAEAQDLKRMLVDEGLWSAYLEVAIGPDAEIFTKSPVLSSVGAGAHIGIRSDSSWNNPEPEIVLVIDSSGNPIGATLGNDVNLRDFEGRSALLLGKAKDNNASCAIGPFIRLFGDDFVMDHVRTEVVQLTIDGPEGFRLEGTNRMQEISRDPMDLVEQAMSEHQYPDGFVLFLGTLFAPTQDRDKPGHGFTHRIGDRVEVASPHLGRLVNIVTTSAEAAPWELGIGALVRNLISRGLVERI